MSAPGRAAPRSHTGLQHAVSVEAVCAAAPVTVARARRLVTSAPGDRGLVAMREGAGLVVAEPAANAVRRDAGPPEVLVRVSRTTRYVVLQVGDHNPAGPPAPPRTATQTAGCGRGLLISRALPARLAWFRQDDRKVARAALRLPPAPGQHDASRCQPGRAA